MELKIQNFNDLGRKTGWNPKENKRIVETAGFMPLEVRLKRLEENGIRYKLEQEALTSDELRKLFLDPQFSIEPGDEYEEINEKLEARRQYLVELSLAKQALQKEEETKAVEKPVETVGKVEAPQEA